MESPISLHSEILLRLFYRTSTTVSKSLILPKPDLSSENIRLVQTVSKLITSDIKLVETENNCYPSYDDFESQDKCISFLPETLKKIA